MVSVVLQISMDEKFIVKNGHSLSIYVYIVSTVFMISYHHNYLLYNIFYTATIEDLALFVYNQGSYYYSLEPAGIFI